MSKTINKLSLTLPSDLEIRLEREFDAPRDLVFLAMSKEEHLKRWWGPPCVQMISCSVDFRVGGKYRFESRDEQGMIHPFTGEYLEIDAPERMVFTQIYDLEPYNQFPATMTVTLEDLGGRTRYVGVIRHLVKEARDGHVGAGMEAGASASYDQLESLLQELKTQKD